MKISILVVGVCALSQLNAHSEILNAAEWRAETHGVRDFAPLTAGRPRPADFDQYWDGEIARQRREVPLKAERVSRTEIAAAKAGFRLWEVAVPSLSEKPATGLVTVPKGASAKSLPILVETCGAGTMTLAPKYYERAIQCVISPYGEKPLESKEYYQQLFRTTLNDYQHRGWQSRETCYFHGQILRLVRMLEWLKMLPEWNGRDLIVTGRSMGGSQALQAGALDPDVTVCAPYDPALCDHAGDIASLPRKPGWPQIVEWARDRSIAGDALAEIRRTADYYDNCNFASRIACRAFFASGYCDRVCPSEGVYRAYQNAKGPKLLVVDPPSPHCKTQNPPFDELLEKTCGSRVP